MSGKLGKPNHRLQDLRTKVGVHMDACDDGSKHKTITLCTAVCMHADSAQPRNQTSTSLRDEAKIMDQGEVPIPSFYFYSRLSIYTYSL
jgi:hypothetical protein